MKHRFLVKSLDHASGRTYVVVDLTNICLLTEMYPQDGYKQDVPTLCFADWEGVELYLDKMGADVVTLEKAHRSGLAMVETYIALKN